MRTSYSAIDAGFSERCHQAARSSIYPSLFHVLPDQMRIESTLVERAPGESWSHSRNSILDGTLKIDRLVYLHPPHLRAPMIVTVQERFRRAEHGEKYGRRDICLGAWNIANSQPAEVYEMAAMYIVYGWGREDGTITDAICVDTATLKRAHIMGALECTERTNRNYQQFYVYRIADLERVGALVWRMGSVEAGS